MRYGFGRYRIEDHRGKSSRYRFHWNPSSRSATGRHTAVPAVVDLHGWCAGIYADSPGGPSGFLYVRAGNRLGWYRAPQPPDPGEYDDDPQARRAFRVLGRHPELPFCRVTALFLDWAEEYEIWIERTCGPDYRRRCHERAPLPWLPPAEARDWLACYRADLARVCGGASGNFTSKDHHESPFICNQRE